MSMRLRWLLVFALCSAAAPALRAQSFTEFCRSVRVVRLGQWAEYDVAGGRSDGSHLRFAIVGSELRGDSTFYWYEVVTTRGPDRFVGQLLVAGLFTATPDVRGLVTKAGNGPSIRVPDMLIVVVGRQIARSVASEVVRHCSNGEVVGPESVTVPAGRFRALHVRSAQGDAWVSADVPFGIVKAHLSDGAEMSLTGRGMDAKSSLAEQ
ncbi:MAG TPA: hypothetical protein VEO73_13365 [Gemmatimonadales bacterium]|nr:hypothetical protein [Gemmatimonadales bacterium]